MSAGDDNNGKVDFIIADSRYTTGTDRSTDPSEYTLFTSEDMRDMAEILGDVVKPEVHGHMYCSSPLLAFWYKAVLSHFRGERMSIAEEQ